MYISQYLSICATGRVRCAILKSRMRNLQISDLNLTLTYLSPNSPGPNPKPNPDRDPKPNPIQIAQLIFFKLWRLTNYTQHVRYTLQGQRLVTVS